jgi:hypothetical protein
MVKLSVVELVFSAHARTALPASIVAAVVGVATDLR